MNGQIEGSLRKRDREGSTLLQTQSRDPEFGGFEGAKEQAGGRRRTEIGMGRWGERGQGSTLEHINCRATGYIGVGWGRATGVSRTENEIILGSVQRGRYGLILTSC